MAPAYLSGLICYSAFYSPHCNPRDHLSVLERAGLINNFNPLYLPSPWPVTIFLPLILFSSLLKYWVPRETLFDHSMMIKGQKCLILIFLKMFIGKY